MERALDALSTLLYYYGWLIFVRILMSWFPGISYHNPLVRVLRALVDPVLTPIRRILPSFSGIDFSPVLAILLAFEASRLVGDLAASANVSVSHEAGILLYEVMRTIAIIFIVLVLLRLFISIFNASPFHPLVMLIRQLSTPLVRPFAGIGPRSRSFDTPALVALAVYIASLSVIVWIFNHVILTS
ncbi:MAG: YggT family protein [Chloroflexi bacterium]|nr:MAG: YggT family protein [Chloroflexota bacterium]